MKAMTVRIPFADMLVGGFKQYELRSRNTHYRGPVAIHTARNTQDCAAWWDKIKSHDVVQQRLQYWPADKLFRPGYVVGVVELVDVVPVDSLRSEVSELERACGGGRWDVPGMLAYRMEMPRIFSTAYLARGQLGLWNWQAPDDWEYNTIIWLGQAERT